MYGRVELVDGEELVTQRGERVAVADVYVAVARLADLHVQARDHEAGCGRCVAAREVRWAPLGGGVRSPA